MKYFSFLNFDDLTSVSLSCKDFWSIVSTNEVFKELVEFKADVPDCIKTRRQIILVFFRFSYDFSNKNDIFLFACEYDHLKVAKWL